MKPRHLNVVPLLCFIMVFAYACYAAAVVGHWPYYSFPDPKNLPAGYLTSGLAFAALTGFASVILIAIAYGIFRLLARIKRWPLPEQKGALAWYGVGAAPWLLDLAMAYASRYSLLSWILD